MSCFPLKRLSRGNAATYCGPFLWAILPTPFSDPYLIIQSHLS